jgi:XTP/dITP diphosphohydrolase
VEGIVEGEIATSESGAEGFGYDPLFIPDGYDRTFADMTADEKNSISHRGRAVAELVKVLKK